MSNKREHAVIYVPGLGDTRTGGQQAAVDSWHVYGVTSRLFQMNWADDEPFAAKQARILQLAEELHGQGKLVSLVGASAGGSAIINTYAKQPELFHGVVCICGKVRSLDNVSPKTYASNRSFYESMQQLAASYEALGDRQRRRILSLHPIYDPVVPVADTRITGAKQGTEPVFGHFAGIAYGLTFGSRRIMRFLKRLPEDRV